MVKVIREARQFKVGPVGVARSSRAGAITNESIAKGANALSAKFFERAVENAEKRGIESVEQYSPEQITTLGADGRPEVYEPPRFMGRIARQAREKALLNRFQTEIELELSDKAKEFSNTFRKNPEGFKEALTNHTKAMIDVEGSSVFKRFIRQRGEELTSNVYDSLVKQANARHDQDMRLHNARQNIEAVDAIESYYSIGDIKNAEATIKAIKETNKNDLEAGYILSGEVANTDRNILKAKARGEITAFLRNKNLTMFGIKRLSLAIATENPQHLTQSTFDSIRPMLEEAYKDSDLFDSIKEFALPLLKASETEEEFELQLSLLKKQKQNQDLRDLTNAAQDAAQGDDLDQSTMIDQLVENFYDQRKQSDNKLDRTLDTELYKAEMTAVTNEVNAFGQALSGIIVSRDADSREDLSLVAMVLKDQRLDSATGDPTPYEVLYDKNPALAKSVRNFLELNENFPKFNFLDTLNADINAIKDDTNFFEKKEQLQNTIQLSQDLKKLNFANADQVSDFENKIENTKLGDEQKASLQESFEFRNGTHKLSDIFNNIRSRQQLASIDHYVMNGAQSEEYKEAYELTEDEIKKIEEARTLLGDNATRVQGQSLSGRRSDALEYEETQIANRKFFAQALSQTVPNTKDNRDLLSSQFDDIAQKMGADNLIDFIVNTNFDLGGEEEQKLLIMLRQASIAPTGLVSVFENLVNEGGFVTPNFSMSRVLNIYDSVNNKINLTQNQVYDNAGTSKLLDPALAATLDKLLASYKNMPSGQMSVKATDAALVERLKQIRTIKNVPEFQNQLEKGLGEVTPNQYVLDNFGKEIGINQDLLLRASEVISVHYAESKSDPANISFDPHTAVRNFLDTRLKQDSMVKEPLSEKTLHSLNLTTGGNEKLFKTYIKNELMKNVVEYNKFGERISEETKYDMFGGLSKVANKINWETEEFYLVPYGEDTQTKGQVYGVVNKDGLAYQMLVDDGEGNKVLTGISIGTREQKFLDLVAKQKASVIDESMTEAQTAETIKFISDQYPAGSVRRKEVFNTLGKNIVEAFNKLETSNADLVQNFNPDDRIYFTNGDFSSESLMADRLFAISEMIKDITDEDPTALTVEIEELGKAASDALAFINYLKVPEDGN